MNGNYVNRYCMVYLLRARLRVKYYSPLQEICLGRNTQQPHTITTTVLRKLKKLKYRQNYCNLLFKIQIYK